jgi:hypothetical protein
MGLLDRFKPQPRWKHADATVRMAGVQEVPEEEQELLAELARTDDDARVRRVAVSKLGNVAVLSEIARSETDAEVRDEAAGVLLDIALGAYEADEEASSAAVDGLRALPHGEALKQLVLVAKSARRESVSRRALEALGTDSRALGTTARRSEHAAIRLAALALVTDEGELAATALRAEYKDVALAALERVTDPAALRAVAARAKNAAAQRRARAAVRAIEERDAAAAAAEARRLAAIEQARRARRDICREVEALASAGDAARVPARLDAFDARWRGLDDEPDADVAARYAQAVHAVRERLAQEEARSAERARQQEARAAALTGRTRIIDQIAALPAPDVAAALPGLREAWEQLDPIPGGDEPSITARFESVWRDAERRAREAHMVHEALERMTALCAEAEAVAADERFPAHAEARTHWKRLREEWRTSVEATHGDGRAAALTERWSAAVEKIRAREQAVREARAHEDQQAIDHARRCIEALARLAAVPDATLKALDRALRDARDVAATLDRLPASPERDDLRRQLEAAQPAIVTRVQELRNADDWQRWANASVQEQLVTRMEALKEVTDPAQAARRMRDLQAEWKTVAAGPRDHGQALWNRFRAAADEIRGRTEQYFVEQAQQRAENLKRKQALIEQAEALAGSTDWIATAEAIKALQVEWKAVGPGPRREEQASWERFRSACDRFFTRRNEDLAARKQSWAENLARKDALAARAETLAESTDWEQAAAELKTLQAEWKTVGPVRKSRSEAVWHRFRTACDRFFERYKQRHAVDVSGRVASREAVVAEAEALAAAASADGAPAEPLTLLRGLRARWTAAPGVPREAHAALTARFDAALAAIAARDAARLTGTEFDIERNLRRLQDLCARAERLAGPAAVVQREVVSPASILATQLREALAANTIGGRADDETRGRAADQEMRQLQAAWTQVGFVPDAQARPLTVRFQRASQRFFDQREQRRRAVAGRPG